MTETEYIAVANLTRARAALHVVKDMLEGPDWGLTEKERDSLIETLYTIQERISDSMKLRATSMSGGRVARNTGAGNTARDTGNPAPETC